MIYGQEGVGKTSLAARADAPIFLDAEGSTVKLGDVARYTWEDGPGGYIPQTFQQVLDAIKDIGTEAHEYGTLVIDGLERIEKLIWDHICERDSGIQSPMNKKGGQLLSVEAYDFGTGPKVAINEWMLLLRYLERVALGKGMDVILIGHACVKNFANPSGEDYDRYNLRLQDSKATTAAGVVKEWADDLAFLCFDGGATSIDDDGKSDKKKGWSTGKRLINFKRTGAYDAKTRTGYADSMLIDDFQWNKTGDK